MDAEIRTPIYECQTTVQKQLALLAAWEGPEANKEAARGFAQYLLAKGVGKVRLAKLLWVVRNLCGLSEKPLTELGKRDLEALVAIINQEEKWSDHTKSDYRRCIKQFFKWYEEEDPRLQGTPEEREKALRLYKYVFKDIKSKPKPKIIDYSNIITDKDARQLIEKGCRESMERAMVAFLHETGCRVGEHLGVRIKDIERKERHALVMVDGKTGKRRIPILQSLPWIDQWLQDHPFKDNPNALLWVSTHHGPHFHKPLRYYGVVRLLDRVFERAGVKKQSNPHWFRHSRATILAPKYSEAVLCEIMGWVSGSIQVRTYVHMGAGQVENNFLQVHGIKPVEEAEPLSQFCICGTTNTGTSRYCFKCGNALTVATVIEDGHKKNLAIDEALDLFTKIVSNPELKKQFEEYKRSGGTNL